MPEVLTIESSGSVAVSCRAYRRRRIEDLRIATSTWRISGIRERPSR